MTDKKISELPSITGADVNDANDVLPIVDTSVATTKKITRAELFKNVNSLNVDGTITGNGLIVDNANNIQINRGGASSAKIFWDRGGTQDASIELDADEDLSISVDDAGLGGNSLKLINNGKQGFLLSDGGDISFYEDTGTTPQFYWDASAEALGIGTTSPSQALDVVGDIEVSGGIYLGGTGSANLLDDYEEGTWTVEAYDAPTGGNVSATTSTGDYTKVGRIVTASVALNNIDTTGMTAGNFLYLTLPFASGIQTVGTVRLYANVDDATVSLAVFAAASATRVLINESRDDAAIGNVTIGDLTSGTSDVAFTISYQV
jgi:hypothetical protein